MKLWSKVTKILFVAIILTSINTSAKNTSANCMCRPIFFSPSEPAPTVSSTLHALKQNLSSTCGALKNWGCAILNKFTTPTLASGKEELSRLSHVLTVTQAIQPQTPACTTAAQAIQATASHINPNYGRWLHFTNTTINDAIVQNGIRSETDLNYLHELGRLQETAQTAARNCLNNTEVVNIVKESYWLRNLKLALADLRYHGSRALTAVIENPFLRWAGIAAIAGISIYSVYKIYKYFRNRRTRDLINEIIMCRHEIDQLKQKIENASATRKTQINVSLIHDQIKLKEDRLRNLVNQLTPSTHNTTQRAE